MFWVSQLSILGPSFFNIFLCDLSLYWKKPVLQVMRITIPLCYSRKFWRRYWVIRRRFDNVVPKIFRWFSNEEANHYNRHFLVNHKNHVSINVNDFKKTKHRIWKITWNRAYFLQGWNTPPFLREPPPFLKPI